ncbi:hypothetical protein TSUD_269010 [Trifolium subterraneum]|uniref:Uncharacterized protein n=1 Tax=Trifolium subterraneum TaxID=3900 RepID=A0A2Z6M9F3_TRISU|nr:hypothetical protein TSUD_269010 [Trifolium subterraneum]
MQVIMSVMLYFRTTENLRYKYNLNSSSVIKNYAQNKTIPASGTTNRITTASLSVQPWQIIGVALDCEISDAAAAINEG